MDLKDYQISDIIYALSFRLDNLHEELLQDLASEENRKEFIQQVQFHFVTEYQKDLFERTNLLDFVTLYNQEEIDKIFTEFAIFFYKNGITDYFLNRGITKEQIDKYKLGSTHILYNVEVTKPFVESLRVKYNNELVDKILYFHLKCTNSIKSLHDSEAFMTIPDFDKDGICKGIVYRTEYFEKISGIRNFHKFFVSHAPLYWFNSQAIEKYDTLIVVEGVFDALALLKLGVKNVISPSSTRISQYEYNLINDKNIHIIFDKDQGGLFGLELFMTQYDKEDRIYSTTYDLLEDERDFDEMKSEEVFKFFEKKEIKYYFKRKEVRLFLRE